MLRHRIDPQTSRSADGRPEHWARESSTEKVGNQIGRSCEIDTSMLPVNHSGQSIAFGALNRKTPGTRRKARGTRRQVRETRRNARETRRNARETRKDERGSSLLFWLVLFG